VFTPAISNGATSRSEDQKVTFWVPRRLDFFNTPTDTPELNSVSERKFQTLREKVMAMLSRSGRQRPSKLRRFTLNTFKSYMTTSNNSGILECS
jgi:hypothetical protein